MYHQHQNAIHDSNIEFLFHDKYQIQEKPVYEGNVYELNHTNSGHISEEEENGDSKINRTF